MRLSNLTAKLTFIKSNAFHTLARSVGIAALGGAALITAAPAAQAQRAFFGARIEAPRYFAPAPPIVVYTQPEYVAPSYSVGGYAVPDVDRRNFDRRDDFRQSDDRGFRHEPARGFDHR